MPLTPVLTKRWLSPQSWTLRTYEQLEGYQALRRALAMDPDEIIKVMKDSSLRGRGGAGFPTGMKWGFIPQNDGKPHYLVVNADEGEPGTCRDAPLMMADPHSLIEGIIIACYAVRAHQAFIYIRGELVHAQRRVRNAIREAREAGYLGRDILGSGFDLDIVAHAGAGAYICGEETALLDSLEGYRGQPRLKPPFPATHGLYSSPTVVNNVGTLASVPYVIMGGADWWKKMGPERSPGTSIYSMSGRIRRPGQYEAPMGTTLRELLEMSGGMREGHQLKFWTPGGSSTPMFTPEHLDVPLDFDSVAKAGSINGTSAVMVFDDSDCVVRAVHRWTAFYAHESCGKCTPCREGTARLRDLLDGRSSGGSSSAGQHAVTELADVVRLASLCGLGQAAPLSILSGFREFPSAFVDLSLKG